MRLSSASTLWFAALSLGCHPPPYDTVRAEVAAIHAQRQAAAVAATFAREALTPVDLAAYRARLPASFRACDSPREDEAADAGTELSLVRGDETLRVRIDLCTFLRFVERNETRLTAALETGGSITLVLAGPQGRNDSYRVGRRASGAHAVIRSYGSYEGESRTGYRPGFCNHMPSPGVDMPWQAYEVSVFVLPGADERVEVIDATYPEINVHLTCDENVY